MKLRTFSRIANVLAFLGIILWFILIPIAMFNYAGGTGDNPSIIGYSFWGNTFSDLGRLFAWNGQLNTTSMILFMFAYGIHSITMIFLYVAFRKQFSGYKFDSKASKIGSYIGILSCIATIGIIFTPADIANTAHWIFVFIGYPSLFLMGVFYSIALILNDKIPKFYGYLIAILSIVFLVTILTGLVGIVFSRDIMVIGQKFARLASSSEYIILIYVSWNLK
ncbi:MAG: hypothetical protein ACFE8V_12080 [Promethearchaeota archaeon]